MRIFCSIDTWPPLRLMVMYCELPGADGLVDPGILPIS